MGGRRPAGARYPHVTTDAREADHRYCPVLEHVRQRVADGKEPWGFLHVMPPVPDRDTAVDAEKGLYRARGHTGRSCGPDQLSVKVSKAQNTDGTWTISFQVWDRATAKKHIAARVDRGEPLPYNVLRR
jgi:hypothetical protein